MSTYSYLRNEGKSLPEFEITKSFSNAGTRNEVRMRVVNELAKEPFGEGKEELASRHTYYVERLTNGKRIYLRRPANLHNGFDFLVCVEGINFNPEGRRRNYPKHDDIIDDLKKKHILSKTEYSKLFMYIEEIYKCKDIDFDKVHLMFKDGYSVEMLLKVIKWLFIEQDIRYWNYSGRNMLWRGILEINYQ